MNNKLLLFLALVPAFSFAEDISFKCNIKIVSDNSGSSQVSTEEVEHLYKYDDEKLSLKLDDEIKHYKCTKNNWVMDCNSWEKDDKTLYDDTISIGRKDLKFFRKQIIQMKDKDGSDIETRYEGQCRIVANHALYEKK